MLFLKISLSRKRNSSSTKLYTIHFLMESTCFLLDGASNDCEGDASSPPSNDCEHSSPPPADGDASSPPPHEGEEASPTFLTRGPRPSRSPPCNAPTQDERHSIIGAHGNHRYTHRLMHHQVVVNRTRFEN